jgi:taurine dioxygenase
LGVEQRNVVLDEVIGDHQFVETLRHLACRHLVYIPDQGVRPDTMTDLASRFGPLLDIRRRGGNARHVSGHPFIRVFSNATGEDGQPLGVGNSSAQIRHSDGTAREVPPSHVAFCCRQVPDPAPRTSFVNMVAGPESLPTETKERIARLRVIHHHYPRQIEVEIARTGRSLPLVERRMGRERPLVRRHMPTTAAALHLPARRDSLVVGWSESDSRALFDELWIHVEQCLQFIRIALQPNDFVIWDNTALAHSREGWPPHEPRVIWHVSAEGEIPTPRFGRPDRNVIGLSGEERRAQAVASAHRVENY